MRTKEFYDLQHAKSYMQNSIVRYRKKPVLIHHIGQGRGKDDYLVSYFNLPDAWKGDEPKLVNFPDNSFDLNPVPLGMVNTPELGVYYMERMPVRQWKVGLSVGNSFSQCVINGKRLYDHRRLLYSSYAVDTIVGKYPTIKDILNSQHKVGAFSRRFAIGAGHLVYRLKVVGTIKDDKPVLDDKFFYLQEVLMEDLNG